MSAGYPFGLRPSMLKEGMARIQGQSGVIGPASKLSAPTLNLSGVDPADPIVVTLELQCVAITGDAARPADNALPRAVIHWGTGPVDNIAECDYRHSTRVTLVASTLTVQALYQTSDGGVVAVGSPELRVSACAAYGNRPSVEPRWTSTIELIQQNQSRDIPIPAFASRVRWFSSAVNSTADIETRTLAAAGPVLRRVRASQLDTIVLSGGAAVVRLHNTTTVGPVDVPMGLIFDLSL